MFALNLSNLFTLTLSRVRTQYQSRSLISDIIDLLFSTTIGYLILGLIALFAFLMKTIEENRVDDSSNKQK